MSMKRKKQILWIYVILVLAVFLGCARQKDDNKKVGLNWCTPYDMKEHGNYLNQLLQEKGYPYEINFITEEEREDADIIDVGMTEWAKPYDTDKEAKTGELLCLDEYLESEPGKKVKNYLPDNVWNTYKIDGKNYTFLSIGFVPKKTVYVWDKELAEKYDVHPETWDFKLWEYSNELEMISKSEKNSFTTVQIGINEIIDLCGYTRAMGYSFPFIYDEENGNGMQFLYETKGFKEALAGIKQLYDLGICKEDSMEDSKFLIVDTTFVNSDIAENLESGYMDRYDYVEVSNQSLWELSVTAKETGVCANSDKKEEALGFLTALFTDADLSNALMWGEEGKDFEVNDNVASPVGCPGTYLDCVYAGNQLLGYAELGQDPNKKESYYRILQEDEESQLSGFRFSANGLESELQECCRIYEETELIDFLDFYDNYDKIVNEFKQAGIDKIMEEWNRQFAEFQNNLR